MRLLLRCQNIIGTTAPLRRPSALRNLSEAIRCDVHSWAGVVYEGVVGGIRGYILRGVGVIENFRFDLGPGDIRYRHDNSGVEGGLPAPSSTVEPCQEKNEAACRN